MQKYNNIFENLTINDKYYKYISTMRAFTNE